MVALSTDKAAAPVNLYGATKLCSDKLFTAANTMVGNRDLKISVVRYGNVMGSRGSVIPFFMNMRSTGILPITHPDMTRFNISLDDGVQMVLWALEAMSGGEIFVPKIPSYRILDVAEAVCPDCSKPVIGIRPGEKLHEEMITDSDAESTVDLGRYFAILPSYQDQAYKLDYINQNSNAGPYTHGAYSSDTNPDFLSVDQLKELIETICTVSRMSRSTRKPIPYGRQTIDDSDIDAVRQALNRDFLTQGPAVGAFESEIESATTASHATAVSSATAGLHLAYKGWV